MKHLAVSFHEIIFEGVFRGGIRGGWGRVGVGLGNWWQVTVIVIVITYGQL